jgi:tetratricopeptide (TPR) repeat protein
VPRPKNGVRLKPDPSSSLVAASRDARADAYLHTGDYERVERILREAAAAAASGDRRLEAAIAAERGMLLHYRAIELTPEERAAADPAPEQELFDQALAVRRELGDVEGTAESLFQLGLVHQVLRRDGDTAAPLLREAMSLIETVGDADPLLRSEIHRHVGFDLLVREERHDQAIAQLRTSLELRRGLSERGWTASGLLALAMAQARRRPPRRGDSARAGGARARPRGGSQGARRGRRRERARRDRDRALCLRTHVLRRLRRALVIHNPPRRGDSALQFVMGRDRRTDGLLR